MGDVSFNIGDPAKTSQLNQFVIRPYSSFLISTTTCPDTFQISFQVLNDWGNPITFQSSIFSVT